MSEYVLIMHIKTPKITTYYSQNYTGTLGSSLIIYCDINDSDMIYNTLCGRIKG